jgi:hypothetical protein
MLTARTIPDAYASGIVRDVISPFDKALDEVSDKNLNGFSQTLNTYPHFLAPSYGSNRGSPFEFG